MKPSYLIRFRSSLGSHPFWVTFCDIFFNIFQDINAYGGKGLTGSVGWPGAQFYQNQENMRLWGTVYHIDESIAKHTTPTSKLKERRTDRRRRSLSKESGILQEQDSWGLLHEPESIEDTPAGTDGEEEGHIEDEETNPVNQTENIDRFFFNKTTDQVSS